MTPTRASAVVLLTLAACTASPPSLAAPDRPYTAYLAIRAADCDTHLQTLYAVLRDDVRPTVALGGVVVVGPPADTAIVRRALASYDVDAPVLTMTAGAGRAFARLARGPDVDAPPSLTVLARDGRIAWTRPSPTTPDQARALRAALVQLGLPSR